MTSSHGRMRPRGVRVPSQEQLKEMQLKFVFVTLNVTLMDMYTVKGYIEELKKTNHKHRYQIFNEEMSKWMGYEESVPMAAVRPMAILCKTFDKKGTEVLDMVTSKVILERSVDDLLKYSTQCGVKAFEALKKDKASIGQITFLKELFMVADMQELYLVTTDEFRREKEKTDKVSVDTLPEQPEFHDPLALMSDESGYYPGRHAMD